MPGNAITEMMSLLSEAAAHNEEPKLVFESPCWVTIWKHQPCLWDFVAHTKSVDNQLFSLCAGVVRLSRLWLFDVSVDSFCFGDFCVPRQHMHVQQLVKTCFSNF